MNHMKLLKKLLNKQIVKKADIIRKDLLEISIKNGAGHIAPSLSCVEILTALYYRILDIYDDPNAD